MCHLRSTARRPLTFQERIFIVSIIEKFVQIYQEQALEEE